MEKSDSQTESQGTFRSRDSEAETQIKPYYRVHGGSAGPSNTEQTMEASLASAHAMLECERRISVEPMLSLIIPTHNAQQWLSPLLERLLSLQAEKEIVIVDDGSTDGTLATVMALREKHPEILLLRHDTGLGRGAALQAGMSAALGKVVVVLDGIIDLENKDIVMLVKPILAGCCDVVYGSHHIVCHPDQESRWRQSANRLITGIVNFCTGQHLTNIESPLKAFRREAVGGIQLQRTHADLELIFQLSHNERRIYEMPLNSLCEKGSIGKSFWGHFTTAVCLLRHALRF